MAGSKVAPYSPEQEFYAFLRFAFAAASHAFHVLSPKSTKWTCKITKISSKIICQVNQIRSIYNYKLLIYKIVRLAKLYSLS
jgi:hypothetical protein